MVCDVVGYTKARDVVYATQLMVCDVVGYTNTCDVVQATQWYVT